MKRSKEIDLTSATWRKSSYSDAQGADCVEVADAVPGVIPVRDSKRAHTSPVLLFPTDAWTAFVTDVKR
ncbi:DUF397 domain-containing protein [Streptomyces hokutonensis]|uniref:DUF397 domain-containing protein n=1 Tax=Streptomyces hokutonensis TaxID=1306990 RepID=UPI00037AF382|nr:DUF397 domain-containing protein [Streptomyces hokutonensis]